MTAVRRVFPGSVEHVTFNYDGNLAIGIGDLLYHSGNSVLPASSQADQGTEHANQKWLARKFAGVAAEARLASGLPGTIPATWDGVYDVDCVSSTWEVGDLIGAKEQSNGTQLENQKVVKVTDPEVAIGYCVRRSAVAAGRVRCRLISKVTPAGIPGPAISRLQSQVLVAAAGNPGGNTSFTDGGSSSGFADFAGTLPAGAMVLGWEANIGGAFAGDTSAAISVGVAGDTSKFSADTAQSAFTTGRRGSAALAAKAFQATSVSPRVTVTGNADFTSIVTNAQGSLVVTLFYVAAF